MDASQLSRRFDRFRHSAFRLETRQSYAIGGAEAERLAAFRQGLPRPERSVATNDYLRQVARAVLDGKQWTRVHIVDEPLSEYLRYQLLGYVESAAAGERVLVARRGASPDLDSLREDFWLFDEGNPTEMAVILNYADDDEFIGVRRARGDALDRCRQARATAMRHAIPLNAYLAATRAGEKVA